MQHANCSPSENLILAAIIGPNQQAVLPREEKRKVTLTVSIILPAWQHRYCHADTSSVEF